MGVQIHETGEQWRVENPSDWEDFRRAIQEGDGYRAVLVYRGAIQISLEDDAAWLESVAARAESEFLRCAEELATPLPLTESSIASTSFWSAETATRLQSILRRGPKRHRPWPRWDGPFVGRKELREALAEQLKSVFCITLCAPGGAGKSRLAAVVAEDFAHSGREVVWYSVGSRARPGTPVEVWADAVGYRGLFGVSPEVWLSERWSSCEWLLVLDNAESDLAAARELLEYARTFPMVRCVVTSREPLHLPGEWVVPVPALTPDESETLFRSRFAPARAALVTPSRVRSAVEASGGHPLSLELAAAGWEAEDARTASWIVGKDDDPVQRAVRWTVDRLPEPARQCLRHALLYNGPFPWATLAPSGRDYLVERGILHRNGEFAAVPAAFREVARHELGPDQDGIVSEDDSYWQRVTADLTASAYTAREGEVFQAWDAAFEAQETALRRWAATHPERFGQMIADLGWPMLMRNRWHAAAHWMAEGLRLGVEGRTRVRVLRWLGLVSAFLSEYEDAREYLEAVIAESAKFGWIEDLALGEATLAMLRADTGQVDEALRLVNQALDRLPARPTDGRLATGWVVMALVMNRAGNPTRAIELAEQALDQFQLANYDWGMASALHEIGVSLATLGQHSAAVDVQETSLRYRRRTGFHRGIAVGLVDQAKSYVALQEPELARKNLREALMLYEMIGDRWGLARGFRTAAKLCESTGNLSDSLIWDAAAARVEQSIGVNAGISATDSDAVRAARVIARTSSTSELVHRRL